MARDGARDALTGEALAGLLARLDPDPDRAGEKYEALRTALVRFFDWRGAPFPDDCADQAIDRLARRIADNEPIADIRSYGLGIARLVWLEQSRAPSARHDFRWTKLSSPSWRFTSRQRRNCRWPTASEMPGRVAGRWPRPDPALLHPRPAPGQIEARAALAREREALWQCPSRPRPASATGSSGAFTTARKPSRRRDMSWSPTQIRPSAHYDPRGLVDAHPVTRRIARR